jgi:hypothetical protein
MVAGLPDYGKRRAQLCRCPLYADGRACANLAAMGDPAFTDVTQ